MNFKAKDAQGIPVAIVGATGYTGEVLLKLVARHPLLSLRTVISRSGAGKAIADVVPRLRGWVDPALKFEYLTPGELSSSKLCEVAFLALPHGVAAEYAIPLAEAGIQTLDLSADFRLFSAETYQRWYGHPHPAPAWLKKVPYILPELSSPDPFKSPLIACPGCYPTSILLPLIPLLSEGGHSGRGIVINSLSGLSGAGKKLSETVLFTERQESLTAYGVTSHRHLSEIEEQLEEAAGHSVTVQFTPHLAPIRQGIHSTIVLPAEGLTLDSVYASWNRRYTGDGFVRILPPGTFPDTRVVLDTNFIEFSALVDERTGNLVITSALDNLWKGASGQAVQILNLAREWPSHTGLI